MKTSQNGFTLIEVLIVVVIIGVLAGIAVPQYGSFLRESRRTDAHIALRSAAQELERCRTQTFTYEGCAIGNTSPDEFYTIAASNLTGTRFTLTADVDTAGSQANDGDCAQFQLDATGRATATDKTGNDTSNQCW